MNGFTDFYPRHGNSFVIRETLVSNGRQKTIPGNCEIDRAVIMTIIG